MKCGNAHNAATALSRAPQGARGLKLARLRGIRQPSAGRAPQGARGLKCLTHPAVSAGSISSRPARGAWVEIFCCVLPNVSAPCRAPQGARGLKCRGGIIGVAKNRRAPQGARGLKFCSEPACLESLGRAPQGARGLKFMKRLRKEFQPGAYRRAPQGARGLKFFSDWRFLIG